MVLGTNVKERLGKARAGSEMKTKELNGMDVCRTHLTIFIYPGQKL